ncbi:ABC transporter permease [Paenibacillus sp. J2TS4]|uniref:ABC transporter permease n=1 Tax=Paenibacillus sp. J2TS4 TaxID=2807194 RepID=UPI001B1635CE|nr:ABC-2 family transporter protein [Paenibacillus sp. J2TS4]GIP31223.1 hypothetical protein J2TS4_04330 [Paenibacillus sp. J2TS4]
MLTAGKLLRFCLFCWKLNLAGALEFRLNFLLTAGMMVINNTVWIFFWGVYFTSFPIVNGWEFRDVMMMWAIGTIGFGVSATLFGNSLQIANMVANGRLDVYLAQPKPVLLHVLVSRMSLSAIGDVLFGLILYGVFGDHTFTGAILFVLASLLATVFFVFFHVLTQSLAFYIGNAEGVGYQLFNIFITFSTYPTDIFRGWIRLVLFTVIPAGFISYMPVGLLREMDFGFILRAAAAALLLTAAALFVFYRGLARYSSGNQIGLRM